MKDKVKVEFDKYEIGTIINALRDFRNDKLKEEISIESIDDLLIKLADIYDNKYNLVKEARKEYGR